ncbi:MAG: hypothetical protein LBK66_03165 [Spirochaetaceae bacterium]|nr:hypothetical protein [Spirochaetaceae bacterium]
MKILVNEDVNTSGLGNAAVPGNYNQPGFGVGTAAPAGPGPDQTLIAQSAAATPNGIDPLNRGFSIGGAQDPLSEFEGALDNPPGMSIGGGTPTSPMNSPSHPATASMKEDGIGMENGHPVGLGEGGNPFGEGENPFAEDDALVFENVDAIPAFADTGDDPGIASLPVDANGIIEPVTVPEDIIAEPELGEIPEAGLPLEEPIVEIDEEDVDIQIPQNVFENDGIPESIPVAESFKLPENQNVIVSKGDQIFFLGHVREECTPRFAESVFTRALKSLSGGKYEGHPIMVGNKQEKVANVGRSLLVEVAKDWRLPGTNTIFEAHDLLQIVSARPVCSIVETVNTDSPKDGDKAKNKNDDAKSEAEEEKLKKEAMLALRRWKEAEKKRKEGDGDGGDDDNDDDDDPEAAAKKERAKREFQMLERQRTGGLL